MNSGMMQFFGTQMPRRLLNLSIITVGPAMPRRKTPLRRAPSSYGSFRA
jgi:hypothetical protein